jgi:hypothetical protein
VIVIVLRRHHLARIRGLSLQYRSQSIRWLRPIRGFWESQAEQIELEDQNGEHGYWVQVSRPTTQKLRLGGVLRSREHWANEMCFQDLHSSASDCWLGANAYASVAKAEGWEKHYGGVVLRYSSSPLSLFVVVVFAGKL